MRRLWFKAAGKVMGSTWELQVILEHQSVVEGFGISGGGRHTVYNWSSNVCSAGLLRD